MEKDKENPAVESENREERSAAQGCATPARNGAKKSEEPGEDSGYRRVLDEARESQNQVERGEKRVTSLQSNGTQFVTNVQVAADAKESKHRTELREARRLRVEKLEREAKSGMEKFEEIIKNWSQDKQKVIPQELHEALERQKQLCAVLLQDKNKFIHELQKELKSRDDYYVKDLNRQREEVDLIIERMEDQIKTQSKTNREELNQIENAYEQEHKVLLTGNREKWEQLMKERRDKEMEKLTERMKKVEEYEAQLQQLRVENAEEYNEIKNKLDTDVHLMEQQLEQMKFTHLLNQEKLEYNLQVLKKRDEESTITKSLQKRKITRLQDILNNLKIKCANQERQSSEEIEILTEDNKRIMRQYKDIQKKMRHFAAVDAKRFEEVWLMNEAEVKELVERAVDIDQVIHQQLLGLAWERPHMTFMELSNPVHPQKQALRTTRQSRSSKEEGMEESTPKGKRAVSSKTVRKLLNLLCDEAGFLIEGKLLKLLSPLQKDEQSLMKLDAIFSAMGVESEDDVDKLAEFFFTFGLQQRKQAEQDSWADAGEYAAKTEGGETSTATSLTSDLIHPNHVLAALKAFTAQHCRSRECSAPTQSSLSALGGRDNAQDAAYWESMANAIPEAKLKTWDALEKALEKYYAVLTERAELITKNDGLKRQNDELRLLLQQSLNSKAPVP
ncbi:dynein regulatory complex protein 1-like [Lampris incognitus]|uniref:dynein regulatory complex protein 1-like n=1 Tax=Lampris incognitus TaxID=2546036 RepID=UPI0024B520C3|nr:dynein regulatory complex protein 1-like [Lampris incognitus]